MKLARIDHYRCAQPAGKWGLYSYVWIPDTMTEDEFGVLCESARTTYLDNEREWKKAEPVYPAGYSPALDPVKDKGKTVEQVYDEWNVKVKAYDEYKDKQKNARKHFAELLVEASGGTIKKFWNEPPAVKFELDWGHNHGVTIEMSDTKIPDFPPEDEDEDYV
jgi:hypothetical protein